MNHFLFDMPLGDSALPAIASDSPSSRLEQLGARALSDTEILSLLVQGGGVPADAAPRVAATLLAAAGSIPQLLEWSPAEFRLIEGIGEQKALQLAAAAEFARRSFLTPAEPAPVLNTPELIFQYLRPICAGLTVEKFFVLALNRKNRLLKCIELTSGTATAALTHPRDALRAVILANGTAFAVAHNHPSGDPSPSSADIQITRMLRDASKTMDIDLIDHVIVGRRERDPLAHGFYSFRTAGLI